MIIKHTAAPAPSVSHSPRLTKIEKSVVTHAMALARCHGARPTPTVLEDPHSLLGTDETVVHARDAHRYIRGTARHQAGPATPGTARCPLPHTGHSQHDGDSEAAVASAFSDVDDSILAMKLGKNSWSTRRAPRAPLVPARHQL
jgi:hypothetical protein